MKSKRVLLRASIIVIIIMLFSQLTAQQKQNIAVQIGVAELNADSATNKNPATYISTKLLENLVSYLIFPIDNPAFIQKIMLRETSKKIANLQKELGTLKEKLDMTSLITNKTNQQKEFLNVSKAFMQKQQEYERLLSQNSASISDQLQVSVAQKLFNYSTDNPLVFCEQNKLDFLVFGTIRVIDTMFLISIRLYSAITQEIIYATTIAGNESTILKNLSDASRSIAETVLQKRLCVIQFTGNPSTATILVNEKKLNSTTYVCLDAEKLSIQIIAKGYTKHIDELSLEPGTSYSYAFELVPVPLKTISIVTVPENADIYVNSIPIGQSPLEVALNTDQDTVTIDKNDYNRVQVSATTINETLSIHLEKSSGQTFEDTFEQVKSRFYQSLGWFVLSLPLATLSYGSFMSIYQTELELQQKVLTGQITYNEAVYAEQQLSTRYWLHQSTFWVALALSFGLGINTIIHLIRYINSM